MIAVYLEHGEVSVREVPEPQLPAGHARIRLLLAGICNTDLELQRGYYGFSGIPGHEFVGEVTEGPREWLGKRVVGEINLACGACDFCSEGLGRHCAARTVLGIVKHPGAFAESLTLPVINLREVPEQVATEHAVFTEPIAAACEILDQVTIARGQPIAVLGKGKLGSLIVQVLRSHGAEVFPFGRGQASERKFPIVVEATGSPTGLNTAIAMTRPRGTVVMKSTVHGDVPVNTAAAIVNEITLVGSRCGRFEPALELLSAGAMDLTPMIDSRYSLRDAPAAFRRAATKGVLKVLLG